ncbi:hypothetical protein ACFL1N_06825 [Thermodesulfobacteriota bacterium]
MSGVVDLGIARLEKKVKKAYRNWAAQFGDKFSVSTGFGDIPDNILAVLAVGTGNSSFYFYDLIMNLENLGSGFGFNELDSDKKLVVLDKHLFLLDRSRYEYMKRLGWIISYPGEEYAIVELIINFDSLAPDIQAKPPLLSGDHPAYEEYSRSNLFEKEQVIRKLIPEALRLIDR